MFAGWISLRSNTCEYTSAKKTSMFRLSLNERLWGGRVSDPPVKASAERKKKTVVQGFFWREGTLQGRRAGGSRTMSAYLHARRH